MTSAPSWDAIREGDELPAFQRTTGFGHWNRYAAVNDEFVYLLEGHIDVIDEDGGVETYKTGDSFVMPRGCTCTWDVKEPVRKLYVVLTAEGYRA